MLTLHDSVRPARCTFGMGGTRYFIRMDACVCVCVCCGWVCARYIRMVREVSIIQKVYTKFAVKEYFYAENVEIESFCKIRPIQDVNRCTIRIVLH